MYTPQRVILRSSMTWPTLWALILFTLSFCSKTKMDNLTDPNELIFWLLVDLNRPTVFLSTSTLPTMGGVSGADSLCSGAGPAGSQAILVATGIRDVNTNWVLKGNTKYYTSSGDLLFSTNSSGIITFPLQRQLTSATTYVWTGADPNTFTQINICTAGVGTEWNSLSGGAMVVTGNAAATDSTFIQDAGSTVTCTSGSASLLCVSQ